MEREETVEKVQTTDQHRQEFPEEETQPVETKPKRPCSVTLAALGVLSIAGINLIRFVQAILQWDFLTSLPGISPLYLALTGLVWALAGFPLWWGLWRGKPWARRATPWAALAYALYTWFDRIFVANVSLSVDRGFAWPFLTAVTVLLLALITWILSRAKVKAYFRRDS